MGVGVGVHPARDGACLYDGQRHPFLWLRDGTHPLATRTREPRPLAQARRIRPAAPVGATNLGPAGRSYPKTARSASAESEVRPDPGHRPYARITPEPRRQGRSTIHILPAESAWSCVAQTMRFNGHTSPRLCALHLAPPRSGRPPRKGVYTPVSPMPPVAVAAAFGFSWGSARLGLPDAGTSTGRPAKTGLGDQPELAGAGDGLGAVGRAEL